MKVLNFFSIFLLSNIIFLETRNSYNLHATYVLHYELRAHLTNVKWEFLFIHRLLLTFIMCTNEWKSLRLVFSDTYRSKSSTFILMCPGGVYIWVGYSPFLCSHKSRETTFQSPNEHLNVQQNFILNILPLQTYLVLPTVLKSPITMLK